MKEKYNLGQSHAFYQYKIIKSQRIPNAGGQVSYNVPKAFFDELLNNNIIFKKESNDQGDDYYLKDGVKFELSKNVLSIIGEEYSKKNNEFFIRVANSNNKPQLFKSAYKQKGDDYSWFVELYDNNGIGNDVIFILDEIKKVVSIDVEFNYKVEVDHNQSELFENDDVLIGEDIKKAPGGENRIFYGAPGCGKSYYVKHLLDRVGVCKKNRIRVTFHPEYSNSDFVGQILPSIEEKIDDVTGEKKEIVSYTFNPGPFTEALLQAYRTNKMVYLVIEEINRGNAAAIFGDLFQLLDRVYDEDKENRYESEYSISNPNLEKYLKDTLNKEGIEYSGSLVIPSNLTIFATMNSSDQNVFTMDTAFKRRWKFEQISNDIKTDTKHSYKNWYIPGTDVTWETFLTKVNDQILENKIYNQTNEDKRMGKYFVTKDCLSENITGTIDASAANNFAYKVLEYLWNDVCKIGREEWFNTSDYRTLEELINAFLHPKANTSPLAIFQNIEFNQNDEN